MKDKPSAEDPKKPIAEDSQRKYPREKLIDLLNEDLSREYQAIIAYVVYSQVIKGAAYMNIAAELAVHATEELSHALIIANADRLPGRDAGGCAETGEDLRESHRYAAVRSRQRD